MTDAKRFFLRTPQRLPGHHGQVLLLVVRNLALPHHEDDLQPLGPQGPGRPAMSVPPGALPVVIRPRPLVLIRLS